MRRRPSFIRQIDRLSRPPRIGPTFGGAWKGPHLSLSLYIVIVCVSLYVLLGVLARLRIVNYEQAVAFLGLSYNGIFRDFRFHQLLTAPLLHGGLSHLIFNMLTLWMIGPDVEQTLGRRRYIILSILCAFTSMLGFAVLTRGTGGIVLGYSGVIFGLLVAEAVYYPERPLTIYGFFSLKMKTAVLLMGAVELYLTLSSPQSSVAHLAHVIGAVVSWLYLSLLRSKKKPGAVKPRMSPVVSGHALRPQNKRVPREL